MHNDEDFFSPEGVDERLELFLLMHDGRACFTDEGEKNRNLLLVYDLRYLYGTEGTENVRSLQRVWKRLLEHQARGQVLPERIHSPKSSHLRLLTHQGGEPVSLNNYQRKKIHTPNRTLVALVAMLFLVVTVGSLLSIARLTNLAASGRASFAARPLNQLSPSAQSAPPLDYPYPPPGQNIALSPASSDTFYALAWSPDGKRLAASTQGTIWLWNLANGDYTALVNTLPDEHIIEALAWSPNGRYLAVGTSPVQVIDLNQGAVVTYSTDYPYSPVNGQSASATALAWSPDGSKLAIAATRHAGAQCLVTIWNMRMDTPLTSWPNQSSTSTTPCSISSLSWSSDSRYIASATTQYVHAWDALSGASIFTHLISGITEVAWSPGGKANAGELAFITNGHTEVWNVWQQVNGPVSIYPDTPNGVLAWSPDGDYLATASGHEIIIYNAQNGAHLYTYTGNIHTVSTLAWSPDGRFLVSGEQSTAGKNVIHVWSA